MPRTSGSRASQALTPVRISVGLSASEGKRAELNGARLRAAEQLRQRVGDARLHARPAGDRQGGPRRAPRVLRPVALRGCCLREQRCPATTPSALAQRNAALKRGDREAVAPWTEQVARFGAELVAARGEVLELLNGPFAERAGELGLDSARLGYEGDPPTAAALEERLDRDLERGATGLGPHLHDVSIAAGSRDLRAFGSQGEQRTAVLALLLAEAALVAERRGETPLLLLDDVLSELDPSRRRVLVEQLTGRGQTLITSTTADALPGEPAQILEVSPGEVRWSG